MMNIQPILDSHTSSAQCKADCLAIRTHHAAGKAIDKEAAIRAIVHYYQHDCPATINNLAEELEVYGTKGSHAAFKYLAFNFTGAKGNGKKDSTRHLAGKDTYMAALAAIDELGLVGWYDSELGKETKASEAKTDEEKAIEKAERLATNAKKWMAKQAKTDPKMAAMLRYGEAFAELNAADPKQAADMLDADIAQLKTSLSTKIGTLQAA